MAQVLFRNAALLDVEAGRTLPGHSVLVEDERIVEVGEGVEDLSVGDRVVTSGRGGQLPPGLGVGVVRSIDDGITIIEPAVDWDRLEYLRLLEYAPVLPPEALADLQREVQGPPLPPGRPKLPAPSMPSRATETRSLSRKQF